MKNKYAVLISLLVFIFVASTVQAQEIDTIVSPLASPLTGARVVTIDPPNYNGAVLRMIKIDTPDYNGVILHMIKIDW